MSPARLFLIPLAAAVLGQPVAVAQDAPARDAAKNREHVQTRPLEDPRDVTLDGTINSSDTQMVQSTVGTKLP